MITVNIIINLKISYYSVKKIKTLFIVKIVTLKFKNNNNSNNNQSNNNQNNNKKMKKNNNTMDIYGILKKIFLLILYYNGNKKTNIIKAKLLKALDLKK